MAKKRSYSKTASERKASRVKQVPAAEEERESTFTEREESACAVKKANKRSAAIIFVAVILAVVLFSVAVILPVALYLYNPYSNGKNPVARFELSNGMTLEYEIYEDAYEIAATNFIFLAINGYFNNTVIFDAQDGYVRFGGFETTTTHRSDNEAYCRAFKAISSDEVEKPTDKFGYKMYNDNGSRNEGGLNGTDSNMLKSDDILTFLYNDFSTEFQFSVEKNHTDRVQIASTSSTTSYQTLEPTMLGRALNDKTKENVKEIYALRENNSSVTSGLMWTPPIPTITINRVRVFNLDGKKWNNFNFIEDTKNYRSGWTGKVEKDD